MSKYIVLLLVLITPLWAESIDEMKKRFMNEIEKCDPYAAIACQLKINNKLMLLFLIEQMKESKK